MEFVQQFSLNTTTNVYFFLIHIFVSVGERISEKCLDNFFLDVCYLIKNT